MGFVQVQIWGGIVIKHSYFIVINICYLLIYFYSHYLHLDPCEMANTYLSSYAEEEPQFFASVDDAKAECLKGTIFYLNKSLEIHIVKLHTQKVTEILVKLYRNCTVLTRSYACEFYHEVRYWSFSLIIKSQLSRDMFYSVQLWRNNLRKLRTCGWN